MVKIVGHRTFTRVEDSKGELLAYVGGSPDRQRVAAEYIVKLFSGESELQLQGLAELQEEVRKLKFHLRQAVNLALSTGTLPLSEQQYLSKCLELSHED